MENAMKKLTKTQIVIYEAFTKYNDPNDIDTIKLAKIYRVSQQRIAGYLRGAMAENSTIAKKLSRINILAPRWFGGQEIPPQPPSERSTLIETTEIRSSHAESPPKTSTPQDMVDYISSLDQKTLNAFRERSPNPPVDELTDEMHQFTRLRTPLDDAMDMQLDIYRNSIITEWIERQNHYKTIRNLSRNLYSQTNYLRHFPQNTYMRNTVDDSKIFRLLLIRMMKTIMEQTPKNPAPKIKRQNNYTIHAQQKVILLNDWTSQSY